MKIAYLALGTNLGAREQNLADARRILSGEHLRMVRASSGASLRGGASDGTRTRSPPSRHGPHRPRDVGRGEGASRAAVERALACNGCFSTRAPTEAQASVAG